MILAEVPEVAMFPWNFKNFKFIAAYVKMSQMRQNLNVKISFIKYRMLKSSHQIKVK